ncbi:MAG: response regulator transcription factor [Lachnospiraceae bacterium]|nr:response regulator transcription factor [Lachnospira sp.]MBR6697118.1 response regulator transcription factor [Lachnospiraceae bacterium]
MDKILLIEDDIYLTKNIRLLLEKNGYEVSAVNNVEQALKYKDIVDLYLMDVMLPDGTGFEVCENVRKTSNKPIIMISAKDDEDSIVRGLELGADDYVTKPFKPNELVSRIRANLRRNSISDRSKIFTSFDLELDLDKRKVLKSGNELNLRNIEFKLLETFVANPEIVIKRERILESIWDSEGNFIEDNTLSVSIKRLREKLGNNPNGCEYIETIRGVGYRWNGMVSIK